MAGRQKRWWQVLAPPGFDDSKPMGAIWETPWCVFGQATIPRDDWDAIVDVACALSPTWGPRLQHYATFDSVKEQPANLEEIETLRNLLYPLAELLPDMPPSLNEGLDGPLHSTVEQADMCREVAKVFSRCLQVNKLPSGWAEVR